jgi:hypothetical protein
MFTYVSEETAASLSYPEDEENTLFRNVNRYIPHYNSIFCLEAGGRTFLRIFGKHIPDYTASHPVRQKSS